jgi:hypothetical protein
VSNVYIATSNGLLSAKLLDGRRWVHRYRREARRAAIYQFKHEHFLSIIFYAISGMAVRA